MIYTLKILTMYLMTVIVMVSCTTKGINTDSNKISNTKDKNKSPMLTSPKVRKVWIPEKIEGDKYIEGHYMWILEKTTIWSQ